MRGIYLFTINLYNFGETYQLDGNGIRLSTHEMETGDGIKRREGLTMGEQWKGVSRGSQT